MIGAGEHTRHMRNDEADEADGASDGYTYADERGYSDQNDQLHFPDVYTDMTGVILTDRKSIQLTSVAQDYCAAAKEGDCQNARMAECGSGQ